MKKIHSLKQIINNTFSKNSPFDKDQVLELVDKMMYTNLNNTKVLDTTFEKFSNMHMITNYKSFKSDKKIKPKEYLLYAKKNVNNINLQQFSTTYGLIKKSFEEYKNKI